MDADDLESFFTMVAQVRWRVCSLKMRKSPPKKVIYF
jgi:hypothetical protein